MVTEEPTYARPTPRKKGGGLVAVVGQMLMWNPFPDMLQGVVARVVGDAAFRMSSMLGTAAYYVYQYRQELREFRDMAGQDLKATVSEIPYQTERLAIRMAIPDFLSLVRPALGLVAAVFLLQGRAIEAVGVYAVGIITDTVDGWLARRLRGGTSWGKDLDGITDSVMNLFVFAAVIVVGIQDQVVWFLGASVFLVLLWVGTRLFTHKHSVIAKLRSGITRGVLYLAITAILPTPWNWVGLGVGALMLALGGTYELGVTRRDLETGRRPFVGKGWVQEYMERRASRS